jgi:arylformamidase
VDKQNEIPWSWEVVVPPLEGRLIDLSQGIFSKAPTYEGLPECLVTPTHTLEKDQLNMTLLTINTHGTTHLDAPFHFVADGRTVDQLDLSKCIGPARMIDLTHKGASQPVEIADLEAYDDTVVPGARLLFRFDWDKVYPEPRYFSDHPYLTVELAEWLASRKVAMIGLDTPTPNQTDWVKVHTILLRAEIVIVEALAHLERLPTHEFFFMAAPLLIVGRDGAPVRAMALV